MLYFRLCQISALHKKPRKLLNFDCSYLENYFRLKNNTIKQLIYVKIIFLNVINPPMAANFKCAPLKIFKNFHIKNGSLNKKKIFIQN